MACLNEKKLNQEAHNEQLLLYDIAVIYFINAIAHYVKTEK